MEWKYQERLEPPYEAPVRHDRLSNVIPFPEGFDSTEEAVMALVDQFYYNDQLDDIKVHQAMVYLAFQLCNDCLRDADLLDLNIKHFLS